MTTPSAYAPVTTTTRRNPRYFLTSAWSIPILVISQFAMLAIIPVALVLFGSLRDARLRAIRPWAIALGVIYATPLVIWLIRPDGAESLSKDMNPIFAVLIAVTAVIVLIRTNKRRIR